MITVVLGGQYGDEGKGSVVSWLASLYKFDLVIRGGGTNAGHSCRAEGETFDMQQLPCSWVSSNAPLYLPEAALVDKEIFLKEVALVRSHGYKGAIYLSSKATLIEEEDKGWRDRTQQIGTMGSGIAPTRAKKCLRVAQKVQGDKDLLEFMLDPFTSHHILDDPLKQILIEGTQGFGLSLNYGDYPYVTSIDITTQSFLAECGVPFGVHKVKPVLVIRTYPVRVPNPPNGSSGLLYNEVSWDELRKRHGNHITTQHDFRPPVYPKPTPKRVGEFDNALVKAAIWHSRPSIIVLTHVDWIFPRIKEYWQTSELATREVNHYLGHIEGGIGRQINFLGIGVGEFLVRGEV